MKTASPAKFKCVCAGFYTCGNWTLLRNEEEDAGYGYRWVLESSDEGVGAHYFQYWQEAVNFVKAKEG